MGGITFLVRVACAYLTWTKEKKKAQVKNSTSEVVSILYSPLMGQTALYVRDKTGFTLVQMRANGVEEEQNKQTASMATS